MSDLEKLWDIVMELRGMLRAHLNESRGEGKHLSSPFKGKVIYIAGKFTAGSTDENVEAAKEYAQKLSDLGHCCLVPHVNFNHYGMNQHDYRQVMFRCLALIHRVDAVFFMPGWKDSLGAQCEWYAAHALYRTIYYDLRDVPDVNKKKER